jgi:hypothetical protein
MLASNISSRSLPLAAERGRSWQPFLRTQICGLLACDFPHGPDPWAASIYARRLPSQSPEDPGLIPLTVAEVRRLLGLLTRSRQTIRHHLRWSWWRRRHQFRARWFHQRTRLRRHAAGP